MAFLFLFSVLLILCALALSLYIYILCDQLSVDLSREQRSLGKQSLLYSQVLERENHCTLRRATWVGDQESGFSPAGGEPREETHGQNGQAPLWKVRMEYARKGMRDSP